MDIKDVKIGMDVRIKDKLDVDYASYGKNGIFLKFGMMQYRGLRCKVRSIDNYKIRLYSPANTWIWDAAWLEPVETAEIHSNNINIHDIYYE